MSISPTPEGDPATGPEGRSRRFDLLAFLLLALVAAAIIGVAIVVGGGGETFD